MMQNTPPAHTATGGALMRWNMKAIVNGKIVTPDGIVMDKSLVFTDRIVGITSDVPACPHIDAKGGYVSPGLVDVHVHGYDGADASDGDLDGLRKMARGIARNGVTSFLPTTMTVSYEVLERAFDAARAFIKNPLPGEARALGVNAEGPFLSPVKRGAHDPAHLRLPDADFLLKHADVIKITTIAPELEGAIDCIEKVTRAGMYVAIGHSTADFDCAKHAVDAGATQATHTFNAMPTLGHRDLALTGEVLWDSRVYCELIADGFHIHPAWFSILQKVKGDHLVLVTDCTRAGGLADGDYDLGGQIMHVRGIQCLLPNGTIAGSVLRYHLAVKNMIDRGGASVFDAIQMASANPARAIGVFDKKGSLEPNKDADIAIFSEAFEPMQTIIAGETAFAGEPRR